MFSLGEVKGVGARHPACVPPVHGRYRTFFGRRRETGLDGSRAFCPHSGAVGDRVDRSAAAMCARQQ